uniref:Uncharacterized protein n=2 Tax=unclassified Caudoviricetes TaxID=2788787 RepID=A0A8S5QD77_9CAUD|nr:MAG TPA: hypothetical protein [Siphoviridae sp. ctQWG7]DAE16753.1 MAG TPA: hypothetical protein [Siphoviridae sp. ct8Hy2]DAK15589.1 MAG TPA: hypothetical protein [Caudoviricetes sp.]DAX87803.1 MAG TPA: hypothetical protein [Caudoviricetes sp.]
MTGRNRLLLSCIIQTSQFDWFSFCPNFDDIKSQGISPLRT